jgi:hypothetical protein
MKQIISDILDRIDKKTVQRAGKRILKKCSFKSSKDLSNIKELAIWLYVYGYYEDAIKVCNLVENEEFTGNYTIWDIIDACLCLKARILRINGDTERADNIIKRVNEYRHPELYPNGLKWYTETVNYNIESNLRDGYKAAAREWMLIKLSHAISYHEAGGYPLGDSILEHDIENLVAELKKEG